MGDRMQQKRRAFNLGIKTALQMKYLKLIIGTIVIIMVLIAITLYATFHLTLTTAQLGRYAEARLNEVFAWFNWLLLGECIIFVVIAGFLSLRLTHRIAGPLYRVEKLVKEVTDKGVLEEIQIRKEDDLHSLVTIINEMIVKFGKK